LNIENKKLYTCYSINLFHFLKANGFYYLFKEFNEATNKYYWVFEKTPELRKALSIWSKQRPSK